MTRCASPVRRCAAGAAQRLPRRGSGRFEASSVNGFDAGVLARNLVEMMQHRYPVVLDKDFAGTLAALGEVSAYYLIWRGAHDLTS